MRRASASAPATRVPPRGARPPGRRSPQTNGVATSADPPSRRALLIALAGTAACGLRHAPVPTPIPRGPVRLGWRWVPGMRLVYRSLVRRRGARRLEEWTYRVEDLDAAGVATLTGRPTGFGAAVEGLGRPELAPLRAAEREALPSGVDLRIGLDGRLVACSLRDFAASLPHRCLALRVPRAPIAPHDVWPDTDLAWAFADLLPTEAPPEADVTLRLLELHHEGRHLRAALETEGGVRAGGGARIHLSGRASWDPERGLLDRRTVRARFTPGDPEPHQDPGLLEVEVWAA